MTKKKNLSQLSMARPLTIPRNAIQCAEARRQGLITGFMSNRKQGAPLKLHPNPKVLWTIQVDAVPIAVTAAATTLTASSRIYDSGTNEVSIGSCNQSQLKWS